MRKVVLIVAASALLIINVLVAAWHPAFAQASAWARQIGSTAEPGTGFERGGEDYAFEVASDSLGNVYVVGSVEGALPGHTHYGNTDAFIRKYTPAGSELWTRQFGTSAGDFAYGVVVDRADNIYVAGLTFGALPGQTESGIGDAFLRKYTASGNELWTRQFGSTGSWRKTEALAVAVDQAGNVAVVGSTEDTLAGQTTAGNDDAFVRKYTASGDELWTRQFGSSKYDRADGVATDAAGNVYVAASFNSGVSGDTHDVVVRKYDPNGAQLWTRQFGDSKNDIAGDIVADAAGNSYVVASINGDWSGLDDGLVRKYDGNGAEIWSRQISSGTGEDRATGVALDESGNLYVAGSAIDMLPGQTGRGDIYVRKYDPGGAEIWTHQFGPDFFDQGEGVAVGPGGEVYVAGYTAGTFAGETRLFPDNDDDAFVARLSQPTSPAATATPTTPAATATPTPPVPSPRVKVYLPLVLRDP